MFVAVFHVFEEQSVKTVGQASFTVIQPTKWRYKREINMPPQLRDAPAYLTIGCDLSHRLGKVPLKIVSLRLDNIGLATVSLNVRVIVQGVLWGLEERH